MARRCGMVYDERKKEGARRDVDVFWIGKKMAKLLRKLVERLTQGIAFFMRRRGRNSAHITLFGVEEAVEMTILIPVFWCIGTGVLLAFPFLGQNPQAEAIVARWMWLPCCAPALLRWLRVRGVAYDARGVSVLGAGIHIEKKWDALRAVRTKRGGKVLEFADGAVRLYGAAGEDFGHFYAMRRQYAPDTYVDDPAAAFRKRAHGRAAKAAVEGGRTGRGAACPLCGGAVQKGVCRGCGLRLL